MHIQILTMAFILKLTGSLYSTRKDGRILNTTFLIIKKWSFFLPKCVHFSPPLVHFSLYVSLTVCICLRLYIYSYILDICLNVFCALCRVVTLQKTNGMPQFMLQIKNSCKQFFSVLIFKNLLCFICWNFCRLIPLINLSWRVSCLCCRLRWF